MSKVVEVEIDQGVAIVTLSRPDKLNALNMEAFQALIDTGRSLSADPTVRAVVLCGAGEHFCAGIDTSTFMSGELDDATNARLLPMADSPANFFQRAALIWRELQVPVIAALHGVVYGAGLQVAMGADIRIAAPSTRCSVMEVRWGIIPDMGISVSARSTVRLDHLRELVYSGRVVGAEEALTIGLLSRLDDNPLQAAKQFAATIAGKSPDAVRAGKIMLNNAFDESPQRVLRREALLQARLLGQANQIEAVRSNMEKREPVFGAAVEIDANID